MVPEGGKGPDCSGLPDRFSKCPGAGLDLLSLGIIAVFSQSGCVILEGHCPIDDITAGFFVNADCSLAALLCLLLAVQAQADSTEFRGAPSHVGMFLPKVGNVDRHCFLEELLSLGVLSLTVRHPPQFFEC